MLDKMVNREFKEKDGIAYFVPENEQDDMAEWAKGLIEGNWIEKNWNTVISNKNENIDSIVKNIISIGGLILEIGTGPGGGFVPYILKEDRNSNLIINDIVPTVIREWKRVLDKETKPKNIQYTVFDYCDMPLKDETIDTVSTIYGFGNTIGNKYKALQEIYRVIKYGGMFVNYDFWINEKNNKHLSEDSLRKIKEKFPDMFMEYTKECGVAGFKKIETEERSTWSNKNDESELASLCHELNTYLNISTFVRYCYK